MRNVYLQIFSKDIPYNHIVFSAIYISHVLRHETCLRSFSLSIFANLASSLPFSSQLDTYIYYII